jgi:hypothetical protein
MAEDIIAKPLMAPGFSNAKPKNPEKYILRWVNFHVGQFGDLNLRQNMSSGCKVATPNEAIVPAVGFVDGSFKYGDLILMYHDRKAVLGSYKHDAIQAMNLLRPDIQKEKVRGTMTQQSSNNPNRNKMSAFIPSDAEIDALTK